MHRVPFIEQSLRPDTPAATQVHHAPAAHPAAPQQRQQTGCRILREPRETGIVDEGEILAVAGHSFSICRS